MHVHRDLLRQIAPGHRRGHRGDVAHLTGEIGRHRVHVVREVLPGPGYPRHPRLASELALGAHLAHHPRHLRGEAVQLDDHRVHDLADPLKLAAQWQAVDLEQHALRQIAVGHRFDDVRNGRRGTHQVADELVHRIHLARPGTDRRRNPHPLIDLTRPADVPADARQLIGDRLVHLHHVVESLRDLPVAAAHVQRHTHGEVALLQRAQRAQQRPALECLRGKCLRSNMQIVHRASPLRNAALAGDAPLGVREDFCHRSACRRGSLSRARSIRV